MNSIKRVYLACRAAVAELNPLMYLISVGILIGMTTLLFFMNGDAGQDSGQLMSELSFWDPKTIVNLITFSGWVSGFILCGNIHNRWFKDGNQAVRTLSLPLSNGERFAAMLLIYLGFVPLVCFGLPQLLVLLLYPLAPDVVFLPATIYLWKALLIGFISHAATMAFWFQPFLAFGNRVFLIIIAMFGVGMFYFFYTQASLPETLEVPYITSLIQNSQIVGVTGYEFLANRAESGIIQVGHTNDESVYYGIQGLLLLIMIAAGGMAITKKTA